jgi:hypothetical protein
MAKPYKYYFVLLLVCFSFNTYGQYLCDYEYKIINKQKRKVKKKCKAIAKKWLIQKKDSLNLPKKLKLSKTKFLADEKEFHKNSLYNPWFEIDSLFCIKKDPEYVKKAIKRMLELQLVVYDIRTEFDFDNSSNVKINSVLNFEFDYNGNLIRAVIRKKKMSPYSEKHPLH